MPFEVWMAREAESAATYQMSDELSGEGTAVQEPALPGEADTQAIVNNA
jgi:hypothetical protein